ncbi:hypothetical protein AB1Y20_010679 [Prymnesium parvum]|uniref:Sulfatase N-terminal domain-containing protein n=1 Tax=Prymnesium parvum TaxID=97485 RepID=A0AB34IQF4_PRYPA
MAGSLASLLAAACGALHESELHPQPPKHVVLIVADDLGYADLGYTGSNISTPHIDRLAADGVKLSNFYVQRACSPSRAALLTGRYNIRYGFQSGVLTDRNNYSLPLEETLLPQFVRRSVPSACHMVGKWHLGYQRWEHTPTFRGFDSFLGYYSGDEDYFAHTGDCGGFDLHDERSARCGPNCSRHMWEAQGVYSTHLFTSRAVSIIEAHDPVKEGSLFLYLPYQAVHVPDQVPAAYMAPYHFDKVEGTDARNIFAGMLSCLDEGVGNVTRALERNRMINETLFWFQTDNGAATPACGGWTGGQNWPFRGGKCTAWEGGLRGVAFVSGAGVQRMRGTTARGIMHTVDVLPTLIAALGGDAAALAAPGFELDGVNQWPMLSRGAAGRRDTVLLEADPLASPWSNRAPDMICSGDEHATPYYALRQHRWKLLLGDPGADDNVHPSIGNGVWCTGPPCPAAHNNSATVAGPWPVHHVMLFDLEADPTESINLAHEYPALVSRLTQLLVEFNSSAVDSRGTCAPNESKQQPSAHNGTCTPWVL